MTKITPLAAIMNYYRDANADVLKKVSDLSDEQLAWRPHSACNSVAFLLWHIARWEDHMQATVPGMTEELSRRLPPGQQIWEGIKLLRNGDLLNYNLENWTWEPVLIAMSPMNRPGLQKKSCSNTPDRHLPQWNMPSVLLTRGNSKRSNAPNSTTSICKERWKNRLPSVMQSWSISSTRITIWEKSIT